MLFFETECKTKSRNLNVCAGGEKRAEGGHVIALTTLSELNLTIFFDPLGNVYLIHNLR